LSTYDPAVCDAMEAEAAAGLAESRRALDDIGRDICAVTGLSAAELAERVSANLAGPPPSLSDIRGAIGDLCGVTVTARQQPTEAA
jgi:hypothetical protein